MLSEENTLKLIRVDRLRDFKRSAEARLDLMKDDEHQGVFFLAAMEEIEDTKQSTGYRLDEQRIADAFNGLRNNHANCNQNRKPCHAKIHAAEVALLEVLSSLKAEEAYI